MKIDRLLRTAGSGSFIVLWLLVASLLAFATHRFHYEADWTHGGRNSLTAPSQAIVKTLKGPVYIDAFAHGPALRHNLRALINKYQRVNSNIHLTFINPDKHPALVRRLNITFNGELRIRYKKRTALVLTASETGITNELARLAQSGIRNLTFLVGNEERKTTDSSMLGLSTWAKDLHDRGFHISTFNPGAGKPLPSDAGILVIADPRVLFLKGEVAMISAFVDQGGDILFLFEPHHTEGLRRVTEALGVTVRHGFAVDPASSLLTGGTPADIAIDRYPDVGPVRGMHLVTVFPTAVALTYQAKPGIKGLPILLTDENAWVQNTPLAGLVTPPAGTKPGALTLGMALTRTSKSHTQRIAILGDGDFASNSFIGEGGNLTFAMNIANWLAHDDTFINLPNRASADLVLSLTSAEEDIITFGFLLILPALLFGVGLWVFWRRRRL